MSLARRSRLAWSIVTVLASAIWTASGSAQTQVRYGDPARTASIGAVNQTDTYVLVGAQQGDRLRIVFSCQNSGNPYYTPYHRIDVYDGATALGALSGNGILDVTIPGSTFYTLRVRATNNTNIGWYAFRLDRMNQPVSAHRIAHGWNMRGDVAAAADFRVYTLRGEVGSSVALNFSCRSSGNPYYTPYHFAELLDDTGQRITSMATNGLSPTVTLPNTGMYTLFVAARSQTLTGWYGVSVQCQSWPTQPCDCVAHASNFSTGFAGTLGVPTLQATAPRLGTATQLTLGSSSPVPSFGVLLLGTNPNNATIANHGGQLLVADPILLAVLHLQPGATSLLLPIPNDAFLCGIGLAMQLLIQDAGAVPGGIATSPGLLFLLGQ